MASSNTRPSSPAPIVLLVEDHADSRELYEEILGASGFQVIAAENGDAAIAKTSDRIPDAIITDVRMPGTVSALDLCRQFSERGVPVIVLTGLGPGPEHDAARKAGCAVLVMKPVLPDALVSELRRVLQMAPAAAMIDALEVGVSKDS